jgi:hypothetical protein
MEIVSDDTGEFVPFVDDDFVDPKLDGTGELGFLVSNAKSIRISLDFNCCCWIYKITLFFVNRN